MHPAPGRPLWPPVLDQFSYFSRIGQDWDRILKLILDQPLQHVWAAFCIEMHVFKFMHSQIYVWL